MGGADSEMVSRHTPVLGLMLCLALLECADASCNRRRRGYSTCRTCPADASTVGNPCGEGYACPSLCRQKSSSYGECCLNDRCGKKDDCEQASIIGTIFSVLFCFCCYGGIGVGIFFCMRAGQPPPNMHNGGVVVQQIGPGGYPGQQQYGQQQYGQPQSGFPGAVQGMADLHTMHAPPPGYSAQPANLGQTDDGWSKTTDASGRVYEYNPATNETRWPDQQPVVATATAVGGEASGGHPGTNGGSEWQTAQDAAGNTYEYNTRTN